MKFSIVIPTYNRDFILARAIKSVLSQPYDDFEIIVVDDGSTDDTSKLITKFNDQRIFYKFLPVSQGVNAARNVGVKMAIGEWISFLDSDDEFLPNAFNTLSYYLNKVQDDIDIVGYLTLREDNSRQGFRSDNFVWKIAYPSYEDIALKKDISGDMHYCVRRDLFARGFEFPEWINGFETFFWSKIAKTSKFIYVNKEIVRTDQSNKWRHLSDNPWLEQPKEFIRGYNLFINEHRQILKYHPDRLYFYYGRISKCYISLNSPCKAFVWGVKAAMVNPKKFILSLILKIKNKLHFFSFPNNN